MILPESLKIKLEHTPFTSDRDYQRPGYSEGDKLVLASDDIEALDNFVKDHSKGYVMIADLIKDLQKCKNVFFGECYHSSFHEHSISSYSSSFRYVYPLSPSILKAINRKEIDD